MKKLYSTLLFFIVTFFITAQNHEGNAAYNKVVETVNENLTGKSSLTARPIATNTSPSGTSTEVGVTEGALNVSLNGSASYTIPILVPPGINGVEPQISINYNSQRGLGGTAAKGWDIGGVSSITRIPATKFHDGKIDPVDFNSWDRFALDGQRLIVKNGPSAYGGDGTIYETEYFSNIKVTSYGVHPSGANYGPLYFLVEYPNGTKAYYGNSTDSRSVMDWSITTIDNPQGIRISYTYINSDNSLYIDSIKYGGLTPSTPINEIKFIYSPKITIIEEGYVGGLNIRRDKNLTSINVIGNGIGFRNYVFDNPDQIKSVTEKSGDNTKTYNPTIFDYSSNSVALIRYTSTNNRLDVGNVQSRNANTISGDFDGDGNMDFILYPTTGASAKAKYWLYTDTNPAVPFSMSIPHDVGSFQDIFPVTYLDSANKLISTQGWTVVKENSFTTYNFHPTWGILQNDQKTYTFPKF
ncbi:MAG: SpvB/TcaC N-terminal domain-containing protein, partial [Flavobacterium sp.]